MSKYVNRLVSPLVFHERGGIIERDGLQYCKETVNIYFVGAYTRKQGLQILREHFGSAKTFFMANGYGNNRQTEKRTFDSINKCQVIHKILLPVGKFTDYAHLPKSIIREMEEFHGNDMPDVVKQSIKNDTISLSPENLIN
jgi:hypothetical protein